MTDATSGLYRLGDLQPTIEGEIFVAPGARVIGDVTLGHEANVWFNAVVRGDNDHIALGARVNVQDGAVLHVDAGVPLLVEDGVSIGHKAMLHGCTVRSGTLVGINAVILNNADIGRDCLIGANALVAEGKRIPERSLVVGSPGRVLRTLSDEEVEAVRYASTSYVEKARRYRDALVPL